MDTHNPDSWQILIAVAWPYIQEAMKTSKGPLFAWITDKTKQLNFWLSPAIALIATAGFHWTWVANGEGGGVWTLSVPPIAAIGHAAGQWLGQHLIYTFAIKHPQQQSELIAQQGQTLALLGQILEHAKNTPAMHSQNVALLEGILSEVKK